MDDKRRRWFQFRLRTLLIAILVLSLPLSWYAERMRKARKHQSAVEAVRQLGGNVFYEWQELGFAWKRAPAWQRSLLGEDYFHRVEGVSFDGLEISDSDLVCLREFRELKTVWLNNTPVTDQGLKHLGELTSLEALMLNHTSVTDTGLIHLNRLVSLQNLWLKETSVTDNGLKHLEGLRNLQAITVTPNITQAGAEQLHQALPHCEVWGFYFEQDVSVQSLSRQ